MSKLPELYELTANPSNKDYQQVSPYVWKTKVDFWILGEKYERKPLSFLQIRNDLSKLTGNDQVTVPTLHDGDKWITDSAKIAEYLDKQHPGKLFGTGTAEARRFVTFVDNWADTSLAISLRPLFRPYFYLLQDADNTKYFSEVKFKKDDIVAELAALRDPEQSAKLAANTRLALAPLEKFLKTSGGPYLLGEKVSHADAAVFGWVLTSLTVPEIREGELGKKIWFSDDLPNVKAWVERLLKETGFEFNFPPPNK